MQEKERSRSRRRSRRKISRKFRSSRRGRTTMTQRVKSAIFFKETELIPSAKIVQMTMS